MDRNNVHHPHPKGKMPSPSHSSEHKPSVAGIALLSFACGGAVMLLMLSLFAVLMMQLDLPHEVLRVPALLSACLGTLACAATASRFVGANRLLCGALCGMACFIILEAAAFFYRGAIQIDEVTLVNAGILLLSGAAGGVLCAMNPRSVRGHHG